MKQRGSMLMHGAGLGLMLLLCACQQDKATDRPGPAAALPPLTYEQIAAVHNARVQSVKSLWVRSVVQIRWTDRDGKKHFEQGDGPLIIRKPSELALAIGKLGNTRFWLGCDADRYWLFDLDKKRTAYVGRQSNIASATRQVLPLPIQPDQMIGLIGLRPLPDTTLAQVEVDEGCYRITLPVDESLGRLEPIFWFDEQLRPVRIVLRDARPATIVDAQLSEYARMKVGESSPGDWPWMAEKLNMILGNGQATVTLFMGEPMDGEQKIKDAQFNFEKLVKLLKAEQIQEVDEPVQGQ